MNPEGIIARSGTDPSSDTEAEDGFHQSTSGMKKLP
jgi:hypothetical protein